MAQGRCRATVTHLDGRELMSRGDACDSKSKSKPAADWVRPRVDTFFYSSRWLCWVLARCRTAPPGGVVSMKGVREQLDVNTISRAATVLCKTLPWRGGVASGPRGMTRVSGSVPSGEPSPAPVSSNTRPRRWWP